MRMNAAAYLRMLEEAKTKKKPRRFRNKPVQFGGLKFDSKREAERWGQLVVLEKLGHITELRRQVAYELAPAVKLEGERRTKPAMRYIVDFEYRGADDKLVVEDIKSPATAKESTFRAKLHLMKSVHGIDVKVSY